MDVILTLSIDDTVGTVWVTRVNTLGAEVQEFDQRLDRFQLIDAKKNRLMHSKIKTT